MFVFCREKVYFKWDGFRIQERKNHFLKQGRIKNKWFLIVTVVVIDTIDQYPAHILGGMAGSHFSIYLNSHVAARMALTNEVRLALTGHIKV